MVSIKICDDKLWSALYIQKQGVLLLWTGAPLKLATSHAICLRENKRTRLGSFNCSKTLLSKSNKIPPQQISKHSLVSLASAGDSALASLARAPGRRGPRSSLSSHFLCLSSSFMSLV